MSITKGDRKTFGKVQYILPDEKLPPKWWLGSLLLYNPNDCIVVELTPNDIELGDSLANTIYTVYKDTYMYKLLLRYIQRDNMKNGDHFTYGFKGAAYNISILKPKCINLVRVYVPHSMNHKVQIFNAMNDLEKKIKDIPDEDIAAHLLQFGV